MKKFLALAAAALVAVVFLVGCHSPVAFLYTAGAVDYVTVYDNDPGPGYVRLEFGCQTYYGGPTHIQGPFTWLKSDENGLPWTVSRFCPNWAPILNTGTVSLEIWH